MADRHPPAPPESTTADRITVDRTGALVAGGLALMAVIGVVTVFSDAIAAAWSPASAAPAAQESTMTPSPTPTVAPAAGHAAAPAGGAADGAPARP